MKSLLYILTPVFILLSVTGSAQTVSGKWYGVGNADYNGTNNNYLIEVILVQKGSIVTGEFNYYFKDAYIPNKISGTYDRKTRRLSIKPFPITYFRSASATNGVECNMNGEFTLLIAKTGSSLKGKFSSTSFYANTCPDIVMNLSFGKDEDNYAPVTPEPEEEVAVVEEKKPEIPVATPVTIEKSEVILTLFLCHVKLCVRNAGDLMMSRNLLDIFEEV